MPQIVNGTSVFCPPRCLVQKEPFCLFLDELNACSLEVQKAFYSLILERRIGEYHLPDGSIVIGAGNRMQDNAITRQLPSALINRMVHVELRPSSRVWLEWAAENGIHPYVYDYLCARPDHLWRQPSKTEEPYSSPRSWHMLSDALYGCGASVSEQQLSVLAYVQAFMEMLGGARLYVTMQSCKNQFYSDLVTPLPDKIDVPGTEIHIFYALKMGEKYRARYEQHFARPVIHEQDLQHEELLACYPERWAQLVKDIMEGKQ